MRLWLGLGLVLALSACGATTNALAPLLVPPAELRPAPAVVPEAGVEAGPELGVPTPEPSPALSPLLPFWRAWPEAPGFLEAPLSGAARAQLVAGQGPEGVVGWAVDAAALNSFALVYGGQREPSWPLPPEAPGAQVAPPTGKGPSQLALGQVVAVQEAGDGDAKAEPGETWRLSAQLLHLSGQSTAWREAHLVWPGGDGQATGSWFFPPVGADKAARWSLPPHPNHPGFRMVVSVPSGDMPPEGWGLQVLWVDGQGVNLPVRLRWPSWEVR